MLVPDEILADPTNKASFGFTDRREALCSVPYIEPLTLAPLFETRE